MTYDSTKDTEEHIGAVAKYLHVFVKRLIRRALNHDRSKLESPEKEIFDEFTPKLQGETYGSKEYMGYLEDMGVALEHHYESNPHHPEHFETGVNGMTLIDLVEMFCDWCAATERHADGDILESIRINQLRFGLSSQLVHIFLNTVHHQRDWRKD